MNAVDRYLFATDYSANADRCRSLSDDYIRRVLGNPKSGPRAVEQARYSAQALEADREASRGAE